MPEESCVELAVNVKKAVFQYKTGGLSVLDNLSLKIPKGNIFALLGPNGSGKTTLIRAILGRIQLKSGSVRTFGIRPGSKCSTIPGKGVGYMPQELALFEDLTIEEIFKYYGTIYHLNTEELTQRIEKLNEVLNLPEKERLISRLSGGQKRRVSILITMIHRPKLIILDEPTVGVDSLLRHKIWLYLEDVCQQNKQTVLITTHYIEEAKSAQNIAFINYGTVLKQSNPQKLLQEYGCQTLETVFLMICENEDNKSKVNVCPETLETVEDDHVESNDKQDQIIDFHRIKAHLMKYSIVSIRNPFYLYIFFLLPFLSLTTLKFALGQYPKNIPVVIFNDDQSGNYSQILIDSIDKEHIDLHFCNNNETAFKSVVNGKNYMSIVFGQNFSQSFDNRIKKSIEISDEELEDSLIRVYADFSNGAIGIALINYLLKAFNDFIKILSTQLGYNYEQYFHIISVKETIYGEFEFNLLNVFVPGSILCMTYLLPVILSEIQLLIDKQNSCLERLLVSGMKPIEILAANLIQNMIIIGIQLILTLFIAFFVYNFTQIGSYFDVFLLLFLTGIQGTASGFFLSLFANDERDVMQMTGVIFFPLIFSSGVFWPVESLPTVLRFIMNLGPLSLPIQAFRSILFRGWTFTHPLVLFGFLINIVYIIFINIFNVILFNKLIK